jgi:hypothetical protein
VIPSGHEKGARPDWLKRRLNPPNLARPALALPGVRALGQTPDEGLPDEDLVPTARLELAQLSPLPPQDSVSTNFTTSALSQALQGSLLHLGSHAQLA